MDLLLHELRIWALAHQILSLSAILALYALLYIIGLIVYRLVFSDLSSFPGPKIAAATYWYEFYYDWLQHGKYIFVIERMHQIYGSCMESLPTRLCI